MSTREPFGTSDAVVSTDRKHPREYIGPDKYNDWIEDYLGATLTESQKEIGRSVAKHERTQVISANGIGKSWFAAALTLAFMFVNYPTSVLATSGTYGKLKRTYCKPVEQLHGRAWGLPGEYKQHPPRIDIEDRPEIYFQAASPSDAGELEGVHNTYTLGIIEEADKDAVDEEILDSMESLATDHRDRMLVISNPPEDEINLVADLRDDETWNTLQYSSFDSQPVRVELGEVDGPAIPNLVTLDRIESDWESWNAKPWPGVEKARRSYERSDLDKRWYRRRLGVMPPEGASANRPFNGDDVENAMSREPQLVTATPNGLAYDVARSGSDANAFIGVFGNEIRVIDYWNGVDHNDNEEQVRGHVQNNWLCPFAVDAIGEGSGVADRIDTWYPNRYRYRAGSMPARTTEFKNCWAESMALLGRFLRDGGSIKDHRLREEMLAAVRTCEYSEKYLKSRDDEVYVLTSKDAIKERLGRSPDLLDAAAMAVHAADDRTGSTQSVPSTWGPQM